MLKPFERKKYEDKLDARLYICYDYILIISKDRVLATHGGSISLITFNADILFTSDLIYVPQYPIDTIDEGNGEAESAVYEYVDDLLIYVQDDKEGVIDYNGNIIVEAKYKNIQFIGESQMEIFP